MCQIHLFQNCLENPVLTNVRLDKACILNLARAGRVLRNIAFCQIPALKGALHAYQAKDHPKLPVKNLASTARSSFLLPNMRCFGISNMHTLWSCLCLVWAPLRMRCWPHNALICTCMLMTSGAHVTLPDVLFTAEIGYVTVFNKLRCQPRPAR